MKLKQSQLYFILAGAFNIWLISYAIIHLFLKEWRHVNEPLHSSIEAMGALAAVGMAKFLLQKKNEEYGGTLFLLAVGFLGMGILDGFHAVTRIGKGFIWLHSIAGLAGGVFFALTWVKGLSSDKVIGWRKSAPWLVTLGALLFSLWAIFARESLPAMIVNGEFTLFAKTINALSGILFALAALRLIIDFHRSEKTVLFLYACMAVLFSMAGFTFRFSAAWDGTWWLLHILRFSAYLLVMGYLVYEYQKTRVGIEELNERERVIEAQHKAFIEVSAPVIKVWDKVLMAPIIGIIDTERARRVMETLLSEIEKTQATVALLDVSGVPAMDTHAVKHLLQTVSAARLMGVECIITGIQPKISQTMVELGLSFSGITTKATVEDGLRAALNPMEQTLRV